VILKFILKIVGRVLITLGFLLGGGLYLGNLAGGDSNKMLELLQTYIHKKTVLPEMPAVAQANGLSDLGNLGNMPDLLKLGGQGTEAVPEAAGNVAPLRPILKADEAKNDQLNPRDNPSEWDYIASKTQKCWFHKRTRKKVCEPITAVP
jgi:hypothetical protein